MEAHLWMNISGMDYLTTLDQNHYLPLFNDSCWSVCETETCWAKHDHTWCMHTIAICTHHGAWLCVNACALGHCTAAQNTSRLFFLVSAGAFSWSAAKVRFFFIYVTSIKHELQAALTFCPTSIHEWYGNTSMTVSYQLFQSVLISVMNLNMQQNSYEWRKLSLFSVVKVTSDLYHLGQISSIC